MDIDFAKIMGWLSVQCTLASTVDIRECLGRPHVSVDNPHSNNRPTHQRHVTRYNTPRYYNAISVSLQAAMILTQLTKVYVIYESQFLLALQQPVMAYATTMIFPRD